MEWLVARNLWRVPLLQQVRCRYHSKKPRLKIMERRVLEAITSPIYQHQLVPDESKDCALLKKESDNAKKSIIEESKFERFLIKEVQTMLNNSWMIAAIEMNSCKMRRTHEIKDALLDEAIELVIFPSVVFKKALQETEYTNLAPAIGPHTCMIFSKEDKMKQFMKIVKKVPEMDLIAGVLGKNMLTRKGLEDYARLPGLDRLRGQFLSISKSEMSRTLSLLQHHQRVLVSRLDRVGATDEGTAD